MSAEAIDSVPGDLSQVRHPIGELVSFTLMSLLPSNPPQDSDVYLPMPRFVVERTAATAEDLLTLPAPEDIHEYQCGHNVRVHYPGPYRLNVDYFGTTNPTEIAVSENSSRFEPFNSVLCPEGADFEGAGVQIFPGEKSQT